MKKRIYFLSTIVVLIINYQLSIINCFAQTTIINDDFSSWPQGWSFYGQLYGTCVAAVCAPNNLIDAPTGFCCANQYLLGQDNTTGAPSPSAHVYNDGSSYCNWAGIQKVVNLSACSGNIILSFNWRAYSTSSSSVTTNADYRIYDASTSAQLYSKVLAAGGTTDTGWLTETQDITSSVACTPNINIVLRTSDGWIANHNRQVWFDNVKVNCTGGVCVVTPIELLSFNAITENNKLVRTEWSTASEINNDYFSIERSTDGITFTQIGTRQGAGNSSATLNYVFYDEHPYTGISYYRLRQVDYDGQFSYSNIRSVYIGTIEIISIHPNPASDYIQYEIGSEEGGIVTVKVFDVVGREVISKEERIESGVASKKISTANLSSGSYLLRITNGSQEKVQKQFVIK